jgi:antitoxin component YwqK of YwqJK toxin-antitoxin module
MKRPLLSLGIFICLLQNVTAQVVLDAHTVRERYFMINSAPRIAMQELQDLYKRSPVQPPRADIPLWQSRPSLYPESYMLEEESSWAKRVWRTISFSDSLNRPLGMFESRDSLRSFISLATEAFMSWTLTGYMDESFIVPMSIYDIKKAMPENPEQIITGLRIKEDWYYDKEAGRLKGAIIGVGITGITPEGEKELIWMYYPELRGVLKNRYTLKDGKTMDYSTYLEQHLFRTAAVREKNHFTSTRSTYAFANIDDTDFDALFNFQLLNEELSHYRGPQGKMVLYGRPANKQAEGKMSSSGKQGKWTVYYPNGQLKYIANFKDNAPHGKYVSYYESGKKREEGQFRKGLREGEFHCWYESGSKLTVRRYKKGFPDSAQQSWHPNGTQYLECTFAGQQLNGKFTRWYANGTMLEQGEMKNGLIHGLWKYNIQLDPEFCSYLLSGHTRPLYDTNRYSKEVLSDCTISFESDYVIEQLPGFSFPSVKNTKQVVYK